MIPCLALQHVSRAFGALMAVNDVTLSVQPGERHVIIGPNGAGKTTLFNVISGELRASGGQLMLFGEDVTRLAPHQRAAHGLARTFQITRLFANLTVNENVLLACMALDRRKFRLLRPMRSCPDLLDRAAAIVERFDLSAVRDTQAGHLAYGEQRRLEVALSMAGRPRLLLLDEPMAGLSPAERAAMQRLLSGLDPDLAVVLIEHDIDMAFAFAENMTVLHQGAVLATGRKQEVAASAAVQQSYLGSHGR